VAVLGVVASVLASALAGVVTIVATPGTAWAASSWLQVSAGLDATCGIQADNSLWCWGINGINASGQDILVPTRVGTDNDWASLSLGTYHACALKTDQTRWCWGTGYFGMPGSAAESEGLPDASETPTGEPSGATWLSVSVGANHTCGIRTDHRLYCWGENEDGQVGNGSFDLQRAPVRVTSLSWASVSAGDAFTCGVTTGGTRYCWGSNGYGQLGLGDFARRKSPIRLLDGWTWATVTAGVGAATACGVRNDGNLYCWGSNETGQLGVGDLSTRNRPTLAGSGWVSVAVAGRLVADGHACGLRWDGTRFCWGHNDVGQLGLGHTSDRTRPTQWLREGAWLSVATGWTHSCGIKANTQLYCWGSNYVGELGLGDQTHRRNATLVP
jgi:alpha-tubulin suppressor-like RCC1 family protein